MDATSLDQVSVNMNRFPLGRFIPQYSKDHFIRWLREKVPDGSWVLDPFCSNPSLTVEIANEGYRLLTCCNNPIIKICIEALAQAVQVTRIKEILEMLGDQKRGDKSLKEYILSLYKTRCPTCQSDATVSRYIWTREPLRITRKVLFCETCNVIREAEADANDQLISDRIAEQPLPPAWAINRLGLTSGFSNEILREAIDLYTPRALMVLFTLINRVEAMQVDRKTQSLLRAMTISACDGGSSFWHEDGSTPSPKQLIKPSRFIEYNIWQFLENSVGYWANRENQVLLNDYPELPQRSGICIFNGKARSAIPLPESVKPRGIIMQLPRINPVFLILSGLWTGWIFGKEKSEMMQGVFLQRDYDWQWQSKALTPTFHVLSRYLPGLPCLVQDAEGTNGSLLADGIAAQNAGWKMDWMEANAKSTDAYFEFNRFGIDPVVQWHEMKDEISEGFVDLASGLDKFCTYDELFGILLSFISGKSRLIAQPENIPLNLLPNLQAFLNELLINPGRAEIENSAAQLSEKRWKFSKK